MPKKQILIAGAVGGVVFLGAGGFLASSESTHKLVKGISSPEPAKKEPKPREASKPKPKAEAASDGVVADTKGSEASTGSRQASVQEASAENNGAEEADAASQSGAAGGDQADRPDRDTVTGPESPFVGKWKLVTSDGIRRVELELTLNEKGNYLAHATVTETVPAVAPAEPANAGGGAAGERIDEAGGQSTERALSLDIAGRWWLEGGAIVLESEQSTMPQVVPAGSLEVYWESAIDEYGHWTYTDGAGIARKMTILH